MCLVLENDYFPREHPVTRCVFSQEVVEAVSVEGSVGSEPAYPLLLNNKLVIGLHLLRCNILFLKLHYITNVSPASLSLLPNRIPLDRRLFIHAVDLHPQLGDG